MCGPLACAPLPSAGAERRRAAAAWHAGRLVAYVAVGVVLGLLGAGAAALLARRVQPVLPWLMAAGLVAAALELGRRWRPPAALARAAGAIARFGARFSAGTRAFALGAATPLLPCGLLWGLFLTAVGTGSALGGAAVMGLFGLGGVPGLSAVQAGAAWGSRWPRASRVLRVAVPLVAAAALVWRALAVPDPLAGSPACH